MAKRVGLARMQVLIENLKRELNWNGSNFLGQTRWRAKVPDVESAAVTLSASDTGGLIEMSRGGGTAFTLPTAQVGLCYNFVVTSVQDGTGAFTFVTPSGAYWSPTSWIIQKDTTATAVNTIVQVGSATDTTVTMTYHATNLTAQIGTHFEVTCVSATTWKISGDHYKDASGAIAFS